MHRSGISHANSSSRQSSHVARTYSSNFQRAIRSTLNCTKVPWPIEEASQWVCTATPQCNPQRTTQGSKQEAKAGHHHHTSGTGGTESAGSACGGYVRGFTQWWGPHSSTTRIRKDKTARSKPAASAWADNRLSTSGPMQRLGPGRPATLQQYQIDSAWTLQQHQYQIDSYWTDQQHQYQIDSYRTDQQHLWVETISHSLALTSVDPIPILLWWLLPRQCTVRNIS